MKLSWRGWLGVVLLLVLVGLQLVPVERTNPPVTATPEWDRPQTEALARRACYEAVDKISWDGMTLRRDIGWRAIARYSHPG